MILLSPDIGCADPSGPLPSGAPGAGMDRPFDARMLQTRILIIEDEAVIAWTLESHFEDLGFTAIDVAPTADDAIAAAASHAPGLIVSDINLGGGPDGITAVVQIIRDIAIPVLFVTGYAGADARARIDGGIPGAAVLRKPVMLGDLRAAVLAALQPTPGH